jgi:glycosyltransferase involved in cell wall biosynthesis
MNNDHGRLRITILIGQTGLGGAERQLVYLLQHGDQERFEYRVIVLNSRAPYTLDEEIEQLGIPLLQLPESCRGVPQRVWWLTRSLREHCPHLLHSWSFYANSYAGVAGRLARVSVRLGSMRNEPESSSVQAMHPLLRRIASRSVHGIVVNSRRALRQMTGSWLPAARLFLVENAVLSPSEVIGAADALTSYGIDPGAPVVGTVGNLCSWKNHEMFINVMKNVIGRVPASRGVIVGRESAQEPGARARLERHIANAGLGDRVVLTGPRRDIPALLHRFTVFCLTSSEEGMPNVVLEAMANACPVVSTRAGDLPTLIADGRNGYLVDVDDDSKMAERVCRLLEDQDLARSLGTAGRQEVQRRYSCRRMAEQMEAVYKDWLTAKGKLT